MPGIKVAITLNDIKCIWEDGDPGPDLELYGDIYVIKKKRGTAIQTERVFHKNSTDRIVINRGDSHYVNIRKEFILEEDEYLLVIGNMFEHDSWPDPDDEFWPDNIIVHDDYVKGSFTAHFVEKDVDSGADQEQFDANFKIEVMHFWELIDNNPASVDIVAGGDQLYQLHNNGKIWRYTGTPLVWEELDHNPATKKIVAENFLYQIHNDGKIWKYMGTPGFWELIDNNPASVDIVASGDQLYQLHNNGKIWRYTGTPIVWEELDHNPDTKKIVAGGYPSLYQIHNSGKIWSYSGTPGVWHLIDSNPASVDIVASGHELYQLHNNGKIWRYENGPGLWQELDNNPATKKIMAALDPHQSGTNSQNFLYQIHKDGGIWIFNFFLGVWQLIDNNPASVEIVASGHELYQIHNSGWIWRFYGYNLL